MTCCPSHEVGSYAGDKTATFRQCLVLVSNMRSQDVGQAEHDHELHGKVCSLNHKLTCSHNAVKTRHVSRFKPARASRYVFERLVSGTWKNSCGPIFSVKHSKKLQSCKTPVAIYLLAQRNVEEDLNLQGTALTASNFALRLHYKDQSVNL